jgi:hypothetical protein
VYCVLEIKDVMAFLKSRTTETDKILCREEHSEVGVPFAVAVAVSAEDG